MATACQLARTRMADFVGSLRSTSGVERGLNAVKAGFIGSIVTPMKGVVGNTSWSAFQNLASQPLAAGIDYIQAVGKSAADGKLSLQPNEYREVVNNLNWSGLKAYRRGFNKGLDVVKQGAASGKKRAGLLQPGSPFGARAAEFVNELKLALNADQAALLLEHAPVKYKRPWMQAAVDGAYAAAEAVDRPFYLAAFEASMNMQGKLYAMRSGLKGAELKRVAAEWAINPPAEMEAEMVLRATKDAQYATFKDKTWLGDLANRAKRFSRELADSEAKTDLPTDILTSKVWRATGKIGMTVLEMNLPFTGVPSSIASKIATVSPYGLVFSAPRILAGGGERATALAEALLGAGGVALGYKLAKEGYLTGAAPSSASERSDLKAAGIGEYELKLTKDAKHGFDLRVLGPVMSSLYTGAALARAHEKNPEQGVGGDIASAYAAQGKYLTDQSYLQNLKSLIEASGDDDKMAALLSSQIPIPALSGQIARAVDDQPREVRGIKQRIQSKIPFASKLLPPMQTSLGDAPKKSALERIGQVTLPVRANTKHDTPELAETRRLGLTIGMPQRAMTVNKRRINIPNDEYRTYVKERGAAIIDEIKYEMGREDYAALDDDEKRRRIEKAIDRQKNIARKPARNSLIRGQP